MADEAPPPSGMTADGKVILNQATIADLRHLPGIGQKRAEAIIQLRQKLGKFRRVTDLLRVKGIGPKRLKQLAPKMVLDAEVRAAGGEGGSSGGVGRTEVGRGTATATGASTGAGI